MGYLIIMGYLASHVLKPFSYFITNSVVVQSSSFLAKLLVHMKAKRIYIYIYIILQRFVFHWDSIIGGGGKRSA